MAARELRLTDLELQGLLATALHSRLREAGFKQGIPTTAHGWLMFPVSLNLSGVVNITRTDAGDWVFIQQDTPGPLDERMAAAAQAHTAAIVQTLTRIGEVD